jgi:hypothetical protein
MRSIVRRVKHLKCGGSNPTPTTDVPAMMQYLYRITSARLGMITELGRLVDDVKISFVE